MKKILGLTIAALIVLAMAGGGTWAYFSDPETGTATLTAGTLDLNINGVNTAQTIISVSNRAPGDSGSGNATIKNVGSLTGELDISTSSANNTAGTGGTEYEGGSGELGDNATMAIYIDVDQSSNYTSGDIGLMYDGTIYNYPTALDYATFNSYASKTWNPSNNGVEQMLTNAEDGVIILWTIPIAATNTIQGDSVILTFTFTLEQPTAD